MSRNSGNAASLVLSKSSLDEIESRWQSALEFYRSRGSVIFMSYCRFWERHGFVQQALARELAIAGIDVTWIDGADWRSYRPAIGASLPHLKVHQMFQLPGRRLPFVSEMNVKMQRNYLDGLLERSGAKPVIWVQAGLDERLASLLPYIDVFSVFDDPYRHTPMGELCQNAQVILTQNSHARQTLVSMLAGKVKQLLPPMEVRSEVFDENARIELPAGFPEKRMGYVGSFFSTGFDLILFEDFIRSFPDYGFILMGRTDEEGMRNVERFRRHKNFHYVPWATRDQVAAAWKLLDLTLLFYRPTRTQDGAFPTKVLESLYYGVPALATQVPKTEDLEPFVLRSPFTDKLKALALKAMETPAAKVREAYTHFAYEMNPKLHLARVAEWMQGKGEKEKVA